MKKLKITLAGFMKLKNTSIIMITTITSMDLDVHVAATTMTTIMIIMQMRYLQAGARRLLRSLQMQIWNRS